jgi:hypothetical protein
MKCQIVGCSSTAKFEKKCALWNYGVRLEAVVYLCTRHCDKLEDIP